MTVLCLRNVFRIDAFMYFCVNDVCIFSIYTVLIKISKIYQSIKYAVRGLTYLRFSVIMDSGYARTHINIVFRAIVLAKITYALPAWRGFLTVEQVGRINPFLNEHLNMVSQLFSCLDLADDGDQTLFNSMLKNNIVSK